MLPSTMTQPQLKMGHDRRLTTGPSLRGRNSLFIAEAY